ncbi:hypothetical protein BAUCODRAFT_499663 [Baudoinia panamericana UAMH 10762]|uniref:Uncharacterized protein n=1 Tax=Baudoinia panamericana (strain UAMH 10762) TaxID=717646 RepID=M2MVZ0_BAUPA|nr:uncharacterized protein BAUCODRAFT_499663 [Baudoinia panamericana UAMH 10762]EMC95723.1 hypothetical protein BAUCODRAFT_499663 [Baudoinia panamericana UAMH 10762]
MLFPAGFDLMAAVQPGMTGARYFEEVILADERVVLLSNATSHLKAIDAGSVTGERVAFIVESAAIVV